MKAASLLSLLALPLLLTGCFTSPNPFYSDEDVIQDDRFLGDYRDAKTLEGFLIQRDMDRKGRYMIRSFEGERGAYWIMFVGTLFKLGDKTFVDLYPIRDSSMYHIGGTPPGSSEILHGLVYQPLHLVVRVDVTDQGVGFSVPQGQQLRTLLQSDRSLGQYIRDESSMLLLPMQTPELRKLLQKHGAGDDVFPKPEKFQKPRSAKESGLRE